MLRLVHSQTVSGALLVDDIDDGLPNKNTHRYGATGDPKAYKRDGYANGEKQKCYVPRVKAGEVTIPGYIDLRETDSVLLSAAKGKISGLTRAGLISVVSLVAADLATPVVTAAHVGVPGAGDLTMAGTGFLSVSPDISTVIITGSGAITLTSAQIVSGGGTFTDTSIVILAASVPGIAATTSSVKVRSDGRTSNTFVATT